MFVFNLSVAVFSGSLSTHKIGSHNLLRKTTVLESQRQETLPLFYRFVLTLSAIKNCPNKMHVKVLAWDFVCFGLGKPPRKKCHFYLGIAQIAIAPPPPHSTGHSGALYFQTNLSNFVKSPF